MHEEIRQLHRRLRNTQLALLAVALVPCIGFLAGANDPSTDALSVQSLSIVDTAGRTRISLGPWGGIPNCHALAFYDVGDVGDRPRARGPSRQRLLLGMYPYVPGAYGIVFSADRGDILNDESIKMIDERGGSSLLFLGGDAGADIDMSTSSARAQLSLDGKAFLHSTPEGTGHLRLAVREGTARTYPGE